jgi:hypothetical protein
MLEGTRWIGAVLVVAAVVVLVPAGGDVARFHPDAPAVDRALAEAIRTAIVDDTAAARKALDRLEELCRRVPYEERRTLGDAIVNADRSFHTALTRSREHAGAGEVDLAFEGIVGVMQVCRACHGFARDEGLWPIDPVPAETPER